MRRWKKILLTATNRTLEEPKLNNLIRHLNVEERIFKLSLQGLVGFAEAFDFESKALRSYLEEQLYSIDLSEFGTLVLGCTHFVYFKKLLENMLPSHIQIVDGNQGTVNQLISLIGHELNREGIQSIRYFDSKKEASSLQFKRYLKQLNQ